MARIYAFFGFSAKLWNEKSYTDKNWCIHSRLWTSVTQFKLILFLVLAWKFLIVEAILTFVFSFCFQSQNKRSRIQTKAGLPERLKNVDKKMANLVLNEIVDQGPTVTFNDIGK